MTSRCTVWFLSDFLKAPVKDVTFHLFCVSPAQHVPPCLSNVKSKHHFLQSKAVILNK